MLRGSQVLIFSENKQKVLLVRRNDYPIWTLPGGRKEPGENYQKTAIRETKEETGLNVKLIKYLGKYHRAWYMRTDSVTAVFIGRKISGQLTLNDEASALKYWPVNKLPLNMLPYLRKRIQDGLASLV